MVAADGQNVLLEARSVSRHFGGVAAVDGVDLALQRGKITGLIGPNGAGKTTLVGLIAGLVKLSSGSIIFDGTDISRAEPDRIARLGIGRTFQNIRLFAGLTALENVEVALLSSGRKSVKRRDTAHRASEILDSVGIPDVADKIATELPYGHQRLVEIARALALEPKLLLLDEPVAGMTDVEAAQVGSVLSDLRARQLSILLIEHNVGFVMSTCDHIYVLDHGRIISSGAPMDIRTDPVVIDAYLGAGHAKR